MKKIEKVIHYIISHFNDSPKKLSKVKLAKILWFSECEYMYRMRKHLTETEFIRLPYGPVPKKFDALLEDMNRRGIIHTFDIHTATHKQTSYHSLIPLDLSGFSAEEVSIIDSVIYELKNKSAKQLSEMSHDSNWEHTQNGDVMPVEMVFDRDAIEPSDEDMEWAMEVMRKKGLCDSQNA